MAIDRRQFLGAASLTTVPRMLFAQATTERRFIFIIQRGAADGLNTLIPYADPAYASAVSLVKAGFQNLAVTRTFSKIYGMAGMRVGYGMAHTRVMDEVRRYYASWNVNVAAVAAASAALGDQAFFKRSFAENQAAKQMVNKTMNKLGLTCIPSESNFILHEIGMDLKAYQRAMSENG